MRANSRSNAWATGCEGQRRPTVLLHLQRDDGAAPGIAVRLATRPGERFFGMGERFGSLDLDGQVLSNRAQDGMGVDDGTQLTLWTRAATQVRVDQLVQAYNASHKNQVTATYVVTDDYQTKIGAAAAANGLPDLFSADVVFMPNWTSAGLFTDITDKIKKEFDKGKVSGEAILRAQGMEEQIAASYNEGLYLHALALAALERVTAGGYRLTKLP